MERGIIAAPFQFNAEGSVLSSSPVVNSEGIRYLALYWDKIVIPDSRAISIQVPEQDVLVETGVVTRPVAPHPNYVDAKTLTQLQAEIAARLIQSDPETDWTLHQIGSSLHIPPGFETELRTVRVELQNILPRPTADVPIAEILDFKHRRRDELIALHLCLDEAYSEILRAPDPNLERKAAIARLTNSIEDLRAAVDPRWKRSGKADFSVELNLDGAKLMQGIAAGAAFDFYSGTGVVIPIGSVVGGVASLLKVSAKKSIAFEPAKQSLKLGYLMSAQSEKILPKN